MAKRPKPSVSVESGPNVRSLLIEWVNGQDNWLRALVNDVIATRKEVPGERAQELYELYLREKELAPGERPVVPALAGGTGVGSVLEAFRIRSLEDLRHVNAISPGQKIEFNAKFTVVFGENAAGKTGYVRVLKRVAAVRSAETILTNVLANMRAGGSPQATLTYELGGKKNTVAWNNEAGVLPFDRMDVFDSRSAEIHLDDELTYTYTPGELALFPLIQAGIEQVQKLLDGQIQTKAASANPYLALFSRQSRIYPKIESLGAATNLKELQDLGRVSKEEEERSAGLKVEIEALRSSTPQAQLTLSESRVRALEAFRPALKAAAEFDPMRYREACKTLQTAEEKQEKATRSAFAGLTIPGLFGGEWQEFVEAGEAYVAAINRPDYPVADDACVYCQQKLSTTAMALIEKYREYCSTAFRAAVEAAQGGVNAQGQGIMALDIGALKARLEESARELGVQKLGLKSVVDKLEHAQKAIRGRAEWSSQELTIAGKETTLKIEKEIADTRMLVTELRTKTKDRDEALKERESVLIEFEARKVLAKHLPAIEAHLGDAQWVDKARAQSRRFSATLRSLTDTAKLASDQLLNEDFGRRFEEESVKLRAPKVRLEFPGRQGQVVRRKAVAAGHRPSETLSEGEQKVIALADFIAEVRLKQPPAPVIFDDPITSLDYRRMGEVVKRLAELAKERQVIVFTHNIWFAAELLASFETSPAECSYYDVRRDGGGLGLVSKGLHPRADTFKSDKATINELIQHAKKAIGATQDALVEKGYEYLRNISEVIVETDLLRGVTQRYQPNVMMTKLSQIRADRLQAAIDGVMPIFEKACRVIASHSQPMETLNVRPSLVELETDWKVLQQLRDAYIQ